MGLADHHVSWSGSGLRHVATGGGRHPLDDLYLGVVPDNRWNSVGVRAYYFASDRGVIVAEWARHIAAEIPPGAVERISRDLWSVPIGPLVALDLRDPRSIAAMGLDPIDTWILDGVRTRATSDHVLAHDREVQGLIVPSVALLDDLRRHSIVVLRDRIDPAAVFGRPSAAGTLTLAAPIGP